MSHTKQLTWIQVVSVAATLIVTKSAACGSDEGNLAGGACPADIDHNSMVNVIDLLAVINGWGSCAARCPPYCAADIDDNCAVNVSDLLAVINAWGPCACPPDNAEPNQTCATARILGSVLGGCGSPGAAVTHSTFALAPVGDVDHYRFFATENCD